MTLFHAMAELKKNSAGKDVDVTNKSTKAGRPSRRIGLPLGLPTLTSSNKGHCD